MIRGYDPKAEWIGLAKRQPGKAIEQKLLSGAGIARQSHSRGSSPEETAVQLVRRRALDPAAATVAGVSVLSSWNFRHMVNFWRIQRYSEVNLQWGYVPLDIRSPKELENEE